MRADQPLINSMIRLFMHMTRFIHVELQALLTKTNDLVLFTRLDVIGQAISVIPHSTR